MNRHKTRELTPAECDQSEPRGAIVNPSGAPLGVTDEAGGGDTLVLCPNVDVESRVPLRRSMSEKRAPKRLDL